MKKVENKKGKLNLQGMKNLVKVLLFSFIFSTLYPFPSTLSAEVPVKFTYQGNIRQNGFLVTGNRDILFRIYDSSHAVVADALWISPVNTVSVSTGVFKVDLEPSIADWESGNLWLELVIEGTTLSPREEVTSSPYAINSLLHSGKRYTTSVSTPAAVVVGDLWLDTAGNIFKFWNGAAWTDVSGGGTDSHALTHAGDGSDPILSLGTHTLTGPITFDSGASLKAGAGAWAGFVSTDLIVTGALNPSSNLSIGGAGYSVSFASSVSGGWFYGNGAGLEDISASNITSGYLSGDRIGQVIVATHVVDGSLTRLKFNQSGCVDTQVLKWDTVGGEWVCAFDDTLAGGENDPLSIHISDTLQPDTTFYVSSGTVNYFTVNNHLDVFGTARIKGSPSTDGLFVNSSGNVGIGALNPLAKLEVLGNDLQSYNLAVGTSTAYSMVVSTSGNVGVGEINPQAKMEVTGDETSGDYIMILNSGTRLAAWLRNK